MTRAGLLSAIVLMALSGEAMARCGHQRIPWTFGRLTSSTWHIRDGGTCTSASNHPENIARIDIDSRPSHGVAGPSGASAVSYRPNDGFKGSDVFTYAVTSNAHYRKGPGWIARVRVYVVSR